MNLALMTAIKFRKGLRKSGMVSLISIISTLSIAIGLAALIIGLSAMNGFERELKTRVLAVMPHGQIYSPIGNMQNWRPTLQALNNDPNITSVMPFVRFTGLLENGTKLSAIEVRGIDPTLEAANSALPNYVLNNRWQAFSEDKGQIIIGAGLAQSLGAKEGSSVTLLIPSLNQENQLKPPKRIRLKVIGILDLSGSLSNNIALIPLHDAQKMLGMDNDVSGLMVNVSNVYQANRIINSAVYKLYKNSHINLYYSSWEQSYGYMYNDIQMIRQIMYLAMIVVIGVACFNIVSTLVIAVKDKQRDIAILKTLGASNRLIRHIFIWYGVISGFIGSILGIVLGVVVSLNLSSITRFIESLLGHKLLNSHIYFIDFLPSKIDPFDIVIVFITAMILSLIASYYPARRACKIQPAQILSGF